VNNRPECLIFNAVFVEAWHILYWRGKQAVHGFDNDAEVVCERVEGLQALKRA
jgi:hypothetical protein